MTLVFRFAACVCMVFLLFSLAGFAVPVAGAVPATAVKLVVKDISTNQRLSSVPVLVKLTNIRSGKVEKSTEYTDSSGEVGYSLGPGNWRIELEIVDPEKEGVAYYGQRLIYTQEKEEFLNRSLYLIPVGALEGVVVHEDGKLAGRARLNFQCPFSGQFDYPDETDDFGAFKVPLVPEGNCRVTAAAGKRIGSTEMLNLSRGRLQSVKIILDQSVTSLRWSTAIAWLIATAAMLIVLLAGYALLRRRIKRDVVTEIESKNVGNGRHRFARRILRRIKQKRKPQPASVLGKPALSSASSGESSGELNPRARDIIQTLNEREKKTVHFLLEQKSRQATQGAIRNATGIPKTSLVRVFDSLEAKKVVSIEKIGKMKKLTLTPWFMGKE